jgi:hypothetical protein
MDNTICVLQVTADAENFSRVVVVKIDSWFMAVANSCLIQAHEVVVANDDRGHMGRGL